jgi:hypothetical protein
MVPCAPGRDSKDMSLYRLRARLLRLATAFTTQSFYALWIRPQLLTWGATPDETTRSYASAPRHQHADQLVAICGRLSR